MRGAIFALALLAGCGAQSPAALPLAATGPVDVVLAGQPFIADLQPGPVLTISRDPVFGMTEGKLAKDVAATFCAGRSQQVSRQAYGQFVGGAWVFNGGCA